jgi:hypothetical protein
MERAIGGRMAGRAALQAAPPHWAVVAVKWCVAGILLLPLGAPLLLTTTGPLWGAHAEGFRMVGSGVAVALWMAMLACAEYLTGHYPPVPRR